MINKSGRWETPLPGIPFLTQVSFFPGYSAIADSDGTLKAQLDHEEAVIVEEVVMEPSRKTKVQPEYKGRWREDFPWGIKLWQYVEAIGRLWYRLSSERKKRAALISSSS